MKNSLIISVGAVLLASVIGAFADGLTGSITSVSTNNGLTGGPITSTGTIGLATITADSVVMNATGSSAVPVGTAMPTTGTNGCAGASNALTYNTSTHALGCNTISGGGSPGGSNTQLQYNNSGAFGGIGSLTYNGSNTISTADVITNLNAAALPAALSGAGYYVGGLDTASALYQVSSFGNSSAFYATRADGTNASPTALVNNDLIAVVGGYGQYDTTAGHLGLAGALRIYATGSFSSSSFPGKDCLATTAASSTTLTDQLCVYSDGGATIGSPTGGDQGAGTLNATGVFINGVSAGTNLYTKTLSGNVSHAAWGNAGIGLIDAAATFTDSSTAASGTATLEDIHVIAQPTLAASNTGVVTTEADTLAIIGAPTAGTNQTITAAISLGVVAGDVALETAGQNLRFYNTGGPGQTNREEGDILWSSNAFTIQTAKAGTGAVRAITISSNGGMNLNAASGNSISLQNAGTTQFTLGTNLASANANGAQIMASACSSTVPTLIPNKSSTTTGWGCQASGNISGIISGVETSRLSSGLWQVAGHEAFTGTAPALSACGTSPTIDAHATDAAGTVSAGTGATTCTLTFATAYATTPHCVVTDESGLVVGYTPGTATLVITSASLGATNIDYRCSQ